MDDKEHSLAKRQVLTRVKHGVSILMIAIGIVLTFLTVATNHDLRIRKRSCCFKLQVNQRELW